MNLETFEKVYRFGDALFTIRVDLIDGNITFSAPLGEGEKSASSFSLTISDAVALANEISKIARELSGQAPQGDF